MRTQTILRRMSVLSLACMLSLTVLPDCPPQEGAGPEILLPESTIMVAAGSVTDLIAAINTANANGDASNVIQLGGGTFTLTAVDNGTWGPTGLPAITKNLTIEGNGSTIVRGAGAPVFRFFAVPSGITLTLRNLNLSGGRAQGGSGGLGRRAGGGGAGLGGAVFNRGTFSAQSCTFLDNSAVGGPGGVGQNGALGGGGGGGVGGSGGNGASWAGGGGGGGMGNGGTSDATYSFAGGGGGGGTRIGSAGNGGAGSYSGSSCVAGAGGLDNGGAGGVGAGSPGGTGGGGGGGGGFCGSGAPGGSGGTGGDGGGGGGAGAGIAPAYNSGGNGGFGGGGGGPDTGGAGSGGYGGGGSGCLGGSTVSAFGGGGSTTNGGGGGAGMGGAIFNDAGLVSLDDCTLSGNTATGGAGGASDTGPGGAGSGYGGGLFNLNGSVWVISSEAASNTASTEGGALYNLAFGGGSPTATLTLTGALVSDVVNNAASLVLTMNGSIPTNVVTGSVVSHGGTVSGSADPACIALAYADPLGICLGQVPCYRSFSRGSRMLCGFMGGTLHASGGRYGEPFTLDKDLTVFLDGNVEFQGSVDQSAGVLLGPPGIWTVRGDLALHGINYIHRTGLILMQGSGGQSVANGAAVTLNGFLIGSGSVGHWKLDEGSGAVAYDSSGNGRDGTLIGGPAWLTGGLPPVFFADPAALSFDGIDDYVWGNATGLPAGQSAMTVLAWIKTVPGGTARQTVFSYGSADAGQAVSLDVSQVAADGHFCVDFYNDSADSGVAVNDGAWHHVGFTLAGGTQFVTLYVDGVAYGRALSVMPNTPATGDFQIGRWVTWGGGDKAPFYFNGAIDDVRVYEYALSSSEIQAVYRGGLALYWKLDEGSGLVAFDSSGNGANGAIEGFPAWILGGLPPVSPSNAAALSFNGSSDVKGEAFSLPSGREPMTVLAWIKTPSAARQTIFSCGIAEPGMCATLDVGQLAPDGHFCVDFYASALDSGVAVSDGAWHHVGFSLSGGTTAVTMYVDGIAIPGALASAPEVASAASFHVARWPSLGTGDTSPYYFNGDVDDVRVYRRVLSPNEVAALAAGSMPAPPENWVTPILPLHVGGNLYILSSKGFLDVRPSGQPITVDRNWTGGPGAFAPGSGSVIFNGSGIQTLTGDTAFYNLLVGGGSTLTTSSNVTVGGTLTNNGWTDETKPVAGPGATSWGLAGITTGVTSQGSLSILRVRRRDRSHPSAPPNLQTGKYWQIEPVGDGYSVDLTLPQPGLADPYACRYDSGNWDFARASFTSTTVTRNGVTAFSDWTVGDGVPSPPPVGDGTNGTTPATFAKNGITPAQIDVTYDASHCSAQRAVILYGALGSYTAGYAGSALCDAGNSGSTSFDGSGLPNVWFNIVWENGTTAGNPGYGFDGTSQVQRTWPASGICDVTADKRDYGGCP